MADDRKVQLGVEVDASRARQGFDEVKQGARDMAQSVAQSGQQAGKGVDAIGVGGDQAAQKLDRSTKSIISSIQRTTAVMEAGKAGSREYFEAIARQRGANVDALRPYLEQLAAATEKQKAAKAALDDLSSSASVLPPQLNDIATSLGKVASVALGGFSFGAAVGKIIEVQRQFDVLNASLVTMTGSAENARTAFAAIQGFAATTPFSLQEVTTAFVKLKSLGLDPSQKALESYGNTASAMGKSLEQFIEAVADASTGEFERLKEFGIRASKEGDQVSLTFQGVTKTIGNSADEITGYLQAIGQVEFAGAMAERARTLDGAISNLADSWDNMFLTISKQDAGSLIFDSVQLATGAIGDLTDIIRAMNGAADENVQATGAMAIAQEGIATVFETVAVLGANVSYVFKAVGTEIGGLAAQVAAVARGDFSGAKFIGEEMKRDAEAARAEIDALTARILNARGAATESAASFDALGGVMNKAGQDGAAGSKEAEKAAKKAAEEAAKLVAAGKSLASSLIDQAGGLSADFAKKWESLSLAYRSGAIGADELAAAQAQLLAQQPAIAAHDKELAKAADERAKALRTIVEAEHGRATTLQGQVEKMRDELATLGLSKQELAAYEAGKLRAAAAAEELAAANLEEAASVAAATPGMEQAVEHYRALAAARREAAQAMTTQAELTLEKAQRQATVDAANDAEREWKRTAESIEQSLTDALMRGFESGKDFGRNLRDSLVNMFRTLVLRPIIAPIAQGVSGLVLQAVGMPAGAAGGGAGGYGLMDYAQAGSTLYNYGSLAYQYAAGTMSGANALGTAYANATGTGLDGLLATNNAYGTAGQSALGTAGSYAAGALAGYAIGKAISGEYSVIGKSGNTAVVVGTAIGSFFGPIGAAIGGAIGGLVNRAFGMGKIKVQGAGIEGQFSAGGADVRTYTDYKQKGGWFRDDKEWTTYALTYGSDMWRFMNAAIQQNTQSIKAYADTLGLNARAVDGYTQSIRLSLHGLSDEAARNAVDSAIAGFTDAMATSAYGAAVRTWQRTGEAVSATLSRLANSLSTVNSVFELLEQNLFATSLAGADAASKLLDQFGGADPFARATTTYYEAYYSEQERVANAAEAMRETLARLGVVMPDTKEQFRAIVEAQDLMTDRGRATYAALIGLSGAFAEVTAATDALAAETESAIAETIDAIRTAWRELTADLVDAIESERANIAAARITVSGGPQVLTRQQIQDRIDGIVLNAPDSSAVVSANAALAAAYQALTGAQGAQDAANATATTALGARELQYDIARQAVALTYQIGAETGFGYVNKNNQTATIAFDEAAKRLVSDFAYLIGPAGQSSAPWLELFRGANFDPNMAGENKYRIAGLTVGQAFDGANARIVAAEKAYNDAIAVLTAADADMATAAADKEAAAAAAAAAQAEYSSAIRDYIVDAGKAVDRLSKLREETVRYYEAQHQLSELMLASSARLRDAVQVSKAGQLSELERLAQMRRDFDLAYTMALSAPGDVKAGYADAMAAQLPPLVTALQDQATSREEWLRGANALYTQSEAIAAQLEASAPRDYQAESLSLLGQIDTMLGTISDVTASAEKIISDAIYETGDANLAGLRAIVAALQGETVPAFATGGYHSGGLRLVGEYGPELEVTGPARIWSADQTRALLSGSGRDGALVTEVRALRAEVASLRAASEATARNTYGTNKTLDRVTRGGEAMQTEAAA